MRNGGQDQRCNSKHPLTMCMYKCVYVHMWCECVCVQRRPQFPQCTVHYDFRGTMRLYGRFLPPRTYPLVVPYVTPALMVCLEVDTPYTINVRRDATLPFYFMQRARWDMCHYFRATIFLVTNGTCDVPLLERAGRIIHVAFVFVKTLTKRCFPTWRPFNLHSRRLVWDNLVFSRRRPSAFYCHVLLYRECQSSRYYCLYNIISVANSKMHLCAELNKTYNYIQVKIWII